MRLWALLLCGASCQAHPPRVGCIYAIEAIGMGQVKIGYAVDPERRLRQLQTGSPHRLELRRTVCPATMAQEAELHRRFAAYRDHGEWFRLTGDVAEWADSR